MFVYFRESETDRQTDIDVRETSLGCLCAQLGIELATYVCALTKA